MRMNITPNDALLIAALEKIGSKDKMRPILQAICFEWETGDDGLTLEATATDSHILASRRLTDVPVDLFVDDQPTGTVMVDGREFAAAVKAVVKAIPKPSKSRTEVVLTFPDGDDDTRRIVTVTGDFDSAPNFPLRVVEGTFPKWRRLFDGQTPQHDGEMPYFGSQLMVRLLQAVHPTGTTRDNTPFQFTSGGTMLKPFGVTCDPQEGATFLGLIMPVRV